MSDLYLEGMAPACICPVRRRLVPPEQPVSTISEEAYPECYEKWEAERAKSEGKPDRD